MVSPSDVGSSNGVIWLPEFVRHVNLRHRPTVAKVPSLRANPQYSGLLILCQNSVFTLWRYKKLLKWLSAPCMAPCVPPFPLRDGTLGTATYLLPLEEGDCAEPEEYDIETHKYHKQKGNNTLYQ